MADMNFPQIKMFSLTRKAQYLYIFFAFHLSALARLLRFQRERWFIIRGSEVVLIDMIGSAL